MTNNASKKLFANTTIEEKLKRIKESYEEKDPSGIKTDTVMGEGDSVFKKFTNLGEEKDWEIGQGNGKSKRLAKLAAAKQAVHNLFSGIEFDEDGIAVTYWYLFKKHFYIKF